MTDPALDTFKFLYERSADGTTEYESIYLHDADLKEDCEIVRDRSKTPIMTDYPIDYSDPKIIKDVIELLQEIFNLQT